MSSWSSLSSVDKYFESRPHLFPQNSNSSNPNPNPSKLINSFINSSSSSSANNNNNPNNNKNNQSKPPELQAIGYLSKNLLNSQSNNNNHTNNGHEQVNSNGLKPIANSTKNSFNNRVAQLSDQWSKDRNQDQSSNSNLPAGLSSSKKFMGGLVSQTEKDAMNAKPRGILAEAAASHKSNNTNPSTSINNQGFLPPPTRVVKPSPKQEEAKEEQEELVEAIYDYEGTSNEDLSFKEHQIIKVTEHISDDWWNGRIGNGPIGMFPSSYVRPV